MSPATKFLADLHSGQFTKAEMRKRWEAGEYTGLKPEWAAEWIRLAGI